MNTIEPNTTEKSIPSRHTALRRLCLVGGAISSLLLAATDLALQPAYHTFLLPPNLPIPVWLLIALLLFKLARTASWTPPLSAFALGWLLTTAVVLCGGFIPIMYSYGHVPLRSGDIVSMALWTYLSCITPILSLTVWTSAVAGLNLLGPHDTLQKTLKQGARRGVFLFLIAVLLVRGSLWLLRRHECNHTRYDSSVLLDSYSGTGSTTYNDKPVIYLYPRHRQNVDVRLSLLSGELSATYPRYNNEFGGWKVVAEPDGSLTDLSDQKPYSYLFWESVNSEVPHYDLTKGFIVKGSEIRQFLADTLPKTGLTPKEYNEFIVYWYPRLMNIPLMQLYFAGAEYDRSAPLSITPQPDSILRVFMVVKPLEHAIELEPQTFSHFERKGFSVVEWGGTVLPSGK